MAVALEDVSGQQLAPIALYAQENFHAQLIGGSVGPKTRLEMRKTSSPSEFDPGPSGP